MKWMAFRVRTKAEAEDIIISSMQDIGLYGAQIEDHVPLTAAEKEQMFVDILPDAGEDDGTAVLSFFLEETEDGKVLVNEEPMTPEEVRSAILEEMAMLRTYSDVGEGTVTIEETEDVDWINNWKQYFHLWRSPPGRSRRSPIRSPRWCFTSTPARRSEPACTRRRSSASARSANT